MGNCCGSTDDTATNPTINNAPDLENFNQQGMICNDGSGGGGGERVGLPEPEVDRIITTNLKVYTFAELKSATKNFNPDLVLGRGGFGSVHKGWIDKTTLATSEASSGIPVAVKKRIADSDQSHKQWNTEINFLGKFSHPNLVRLIGYCSEDKELLLVYEYLNKGSLESLLFQNDRDPPSWNTRISIAIDAARGLDFLHTSENKVIFRDFKPANILLDENYVAKLWDFGFARSGPPADKSHVTTQAMGSLGYVAPEYANTDHLYVRSDVYGFGVVMLEMLTGLRAYDKKRGDSRMILVDWYKPVLSKRYSKLEMIIDPRMKKYPPEGVRELVQLILGCLQDEPENRPPMSKVLTVLERIRSIKIRKSSKASSSKSKGHDSKPSRVPPSPQE